MTFVSFVASIGSIAAGLFLLSYGSWSSDSTGETSWFAIIGHGMGIYFVARGFAIGPTLWHTAKQSRLLEDLVLFQSRSRDEDD